MEDELIHRVAVSPKGNQYKITVAPWSQGNDGVLNPQSSYGLATFDAKQHFYVLSSNEYLMKNDFDAHLPRDGDV